MRAIISTLSWRLFMLYFVLKIILPVCDDLRVILIRATLALFGNLLA
jgi:hypothetical protein